MAKEAKIAYRDMDLTELNQALVETQQDLLIARKSLVAGDLANPMKIKQLKSDVARIKTAISAKLITKLNEEEK